MPARGAATPVPLTLSVVVPVRDEAESIGLLIREIRGVFEQAGEHELVVVDDGSRDGTAKLLAEAAREWPSLSVVTHAVSCGQSAALWSGVKRARAPWVATLDGDGQNDPADIPRLLARSGADGSSSGCDMVVGHRLKRRDSAMKRVASRVANAIRSCALGDRTPDTGCGLKLFRRDAYLALPYFDHMHRFLPALIQRAGGRVISVEVNHRPRLHGRSKYGVWDRLWVGLVDMAGVMWLKRRARFPVESRDDR